LIKYKLRYVDQAFRLARLGATEEMMAHFFEVSVFVLYEWIETNPEFETAIEHGKVLPELAAALGAKMAEMKIIGLDAMAVFNDALRDVVTAIQPARMNPRRV
jgi:hypothetical protein